MNIFISNIIVSNLEPETQRTIYIWVASYGAFCLLCQIITSILIIKKRQQKNIIWDLLGAIFLLILGFIAAFIIPLAAVCPGERFINLTANTVIALIGFTIVCPIWPAAMLMFWLNPLILFFNIKYPDRISPDMFNP